MSNQLIECVPNFSEGRNAKLIECIIKPFRNLKGCRLVDYRADRDHNRLVISLVGFPEAVQDALLEAAKLAVERIDMELHQGRHPRIGAVDVIPFTPIRNISMDDCVTLVHEFGNRFHEATNVPVYFYEEAALIPSHKQLEDVRRGQYEGLKSAIKDPDRRPDIGGAELHPSAGATVIGARKFLIAFNVNLATDNLVIAQTIAKAVRASSGGLCCVKGIGVLLKERGVVQVSMNIVDYEKNPLYRVLELIRIESRRFGVSVIESEIVGMAPVAALLDTAAYHIQLTGFKHDQIIELGLLDMSGGDGDERK